MSNARNQKAHSLRKYMTRRSFREGFEDYVTGRPPRFDDYPKGEQWSYERGRHFAAANPTLRRYKHGNAITNEAVRLMCNSLDQKEII